MSECGVVRNDIPLLLTESLEAEARESAHAHIERCGGCEQEWLSARSVWMTMSEVPDVPVPPRLRSRFLEQIAREFPPAVMAAESHAGGVVVPFHRQPAIRWWSQAAAIVLLAGGAFIAGSWQGRQPQAESTQMMAQAPRFSLADQAIIPASYLEESLPPRLNIQNLEFYDNPSDPSEIGVSFDLTQRVTVTGSPEDRNLVRLVTQMLENNDYPSAFRSTAVQWVSDRYSRGVSADPELVRALANLLKTDSHEGMRIQAADALKAMPPAAAPEAQTALIDALKNDPNPAVRIMAIEALANLARTSGTMQGTAVDTLREKAAQNDENAYVRVKAAEALGQLDL
jgi:hypothetical protein